MKVSLGVSNFLEEISNLSHSIVFLYFFALYHWGRLSISSGYSLELCIQMGISFLFSFVRRNSLWVYNWFSEFMVSSGARSIISYIVETCSICTMNSLNNRPLRGPQIRPVQTWGTYPREDWQVDFTVMLGILPSNFRYLLVQVDSFSAWIEALVGLPRWH